MYEYELIRSKRKTLAVEIDYDGHVILRAPRWVSKKEIENFAALREPWVKKHLAEVRSRQAFAPPKLTDSEIKALTENAKCEFKELVDLWAPRILRGFGGETSGVQLSIFDLFPDIADRPVAEKKVRKIHIGHQRTRWGSCSQAGTLSFNCLLMLAPREVREYVAVHELCHMHEMNHSQKFWSRVKQALPNYRVQYKWLKENGGSLLARLPR